MNDKGVCRTAPATPGLLKTVSLGMLKIRPMQEANQEIAVSSKVLVSAALLLPNPIHEIGCLDRDTVKCPVCPVLPVVQLTILKLDKPYNRQTLHRLALLLYPPKTKF